MIKYTMQIKPGYFKNFNFGVSKITQYLNIPVNKSGIYQMKRL